MEDKIDLYFCYYDLIIKQSLISLEYRSSLDLNFDSKS